MYVELRGAIMETQKYNGLAEVRSTAPKFNGPFAEVQKFSMTLEYL